MFRGVGMPQVRHPERSAAIQWHGGTGLPRCARGDDSGDVPVTDFITQNHEVHTVQIGYFRGFAD